VTLRHNDRITAANNASGRCFTSICYSADGAYLLAGGNSKFVCLYDVEERVLLRRFRIATSRALDGVLDQLSSKNMTDAVRSQHGRRGTAVGTQHLCPASPSRGGMSGLAGVTTRPAGYPSSGVPPAVERQLHLLTQLRMQSCFRAIVHRAFRVHHAPHSLHSTGVQ
jgi:hypothetical protein